MRRTLLRLAQAAMSRTWVLRGLVACAALTAAGLALGWRLQREQEALVTVQREQEASRKVMAKLGTLQTLVETSLKEQALLAQELAALHF